MRTATSRCVLNSKAEMDPLIIQAKNTFKFLEKLRKQDCHQTDRQHALCQKMTG